jgi:adenylyltransferase/sulfurtransferase
MYLAAAGIGTLGLIDDDLVEESNLQRQIIHGVSALGKPKAESAQARMREINPYITVNAFTVRLNSANALDLFSGFDIIVDGSDNFPTRYLVNDACALLGKPLVYGAIYRFEGQVAVFDARRSGACLRCLFPEPPDPALVTTCGQGGVLGALPGIVGSIQANEVIKLIVGNGRPLVDRLWHIDSWIMRCHEFTLAKNPSCPLCGDAPSITGLIDYEAFCGIQKEAEVPRAPSISAQALKARLDRGEALTIIDLRLPQELVMGSLPGAVCLPLAALLTDMTGLDPAKETVLVCKQGEKSEIAVMELLERGYAGRLLNLSGGMNAWAREVDPSVPVY